MAQKKTPMLNVDLGDARIAVENITNATRTSSMNECIRQVFMHLQREMERKGIANLVYSDITIDQK